MGLKEKINEIVHNVQDIRELHPENTQDRIREIAVNEIMLLIETSLDVFQDSPYFEEESLAL